MAFVSTGQCSVINNVAFPCDRWPNHCCLQWHESNQTDRGGQVHSTAASAHRLLGPKAIATGHRMVFRNVRHPFIGLCAVVRKLVAQFGCTQPRYTLGRGISECLCQLCVPSQTVWPIIGRFCSDRRSALIGGLLCSALAAKLTEGSILGWRHLPGARRFTRHPFIATAGSHCSKQWWPLLIIDPCLCRTPTVMQQIKLTCSHHHVWLVCNVRCMRSSLNGRISYRIG